MLNLLFTALAEAGDRSLLVRPVPEIPIFQWQVLGITLATQHIDTTVTGYGVYSGSCRGLFGIVASGFIPNLDHHFLDQVIAEAGKPGLTAAGMGKALEQRAEVFKQFGKGLSTWSRHCDKQLAPLVRAFSGLFKIATGLSLACFCFRLLFLNLS